MSRKLSKRHFWQWFEHNNNEYLQLDTKSKKEFNYWINELRAHLRAYFKFLDFTLSHLQDGKTGQLTISVSGAAGRFKYVDALVAMAPAITNWKIQALDEAIPMEFLLEEQCGVTGIDPYEFRFLPEGEGVDLYIYHPLYTEERQGVFEHVAEVALYNLLGERSFGLDIRRIYLDNLSCASEDAQLLHPEELPVYLGERKSTFMVDAAGRLICGVGNRV